MHHDEWHSDSVGNLFRGLHGSPAGFICKFAAYCPFSQDFGVWVPSRNQLQDFQHTSRHQLPVCMCIRFCGFLESLPVHGLPGRGGSECGAQSMHEMRWWTRLCEATSNIFGSLGVANHDFFMFLYVMLRGNVGIVQTVILCISTFLRSPQMF